MTVNANDFFLRVIITAAADLTRYSGGETNRCFPPFEKGGRGVRGELEKLLATSLVALLLGLPPGKCLLPGL
jgi:hypothetical protein